MVENNFKINSSDSRIILEKDNKSFIVSKTSDNDFWFYAKEDQFIFEFDINTSSYSELKTYLIFESLMKSIIGRYILNSDYKNEYSNLPEDFICFQHSVITWHSDSNVDNVLKLEYLNPNIKISISKCKDSKKNDKNSIRIRRSGSSYGYYYQEFIKFYDELLELAVSLDKPILDDIVQKEEKTKKKSLFKDWLKK